MKHKLNIFYRMSACLLLIVPLGCFGNEVEYLDHDLWRPFEQSGHNAVVRDDFGTAEHYYDDAISVMNIDVAFVWLEYGQVCSQRGKFQRAEEAYKRALDVVLKREEKAAKGDYYAYLGDFYLEWGKNDEAQKSFQQADFYWRLFLKEAPWNDTQGPPLAGRFAHLHLVRGEYDLAIPLLTERIRLQKRDGVSPTDLSVLADWLAAAYYEKGNLDQAWSSLLPYYQARDSVFLDLSDASKSIAILLGKIEDKRGRSDEALEIYRSALKVDPKFPLFGRVNRADIFNQIGRFYIKHGNAKEAESAYTSSFRLRLETQTEGSPDCADAVKGLADVSVAEDHLTSATAYAKRALAIMDASLVPTHPRVAPVLIALSSISILTKQSEAAAGLDVRVEAICEKPLGLWKEDIIDTAGFYAEALRKAGKTEAASNLEKLQSRQKDRR